MNQKEMERWYRLKYMMKACRVLVIASVALIVAWYATSWYFKHKPEELAPLRTNDQQTRIERFSYSSPGAYPWELRAESAVVSPSLEQVALTQPKVRYKGGVGGEIFLESETGELDRKTQHVTARGGVHIRLRDFHFSTDEVNYFHDTLVAQTDSSVTLEGNDLRVCGKGLKVSVETEEVTIQEDVRIELFNVSMVGPNGRLPM